MRSEIPADLLKELKSDVQDGSEGELHDQTIPKIKQELHDAIHKEVLQETKRELVPFLTRTGESLNTILCISYGLLVALGLGVLLFKLFVPIKAPLFVVDWIPVPKNVYVRGRYGIKIGQCHGDRDLISTIPQWLYNTTATL